MKKYVLFAIFFVSLSGLLSGFDTGVISGAILYIEDAFKLTPVLSGLLVSSVSFGAILGALINGVLIDKFGRRKILLLSACIFFFGSLFSAFSHNIVQLIISRALLGLAVGIVRFAGPLYLREISTKEKRGATVSFYQIALTFGILFSYFVDYFCSQINLNWRVMFFIGAIPAFVMFFGLLSNLIGSC